MNNSARCRESWVVGVRAKEGQRPVDMLLPYTYELIRGGAMSVKPSSQIS